MKNTFGSQVKITVYGESHGPSVGVVIDGLTPGLDVNKKEIVRMMNLRKANDSSISTARKECDEVIIESGVLNDKTTGTPLMIRIANKDVKSEDYNQFKNIPRPGHADFAASCKYHGFEDSNGGGHFSGRVTAGIVAAGGIILPALLKKGIKIKTRIKSIKNVVDEASIEDIWEIKEENFPVINSKKAEEMKLAIKEARDSGDSLGGVVETVISGMPKGIGEPWFDTIEGLLSHAVFSIPAVKAIEFGEGFGITTKSGSEANDCYVEKNGNIECATNNNGGILGGITNGMPIVFRTGIKPTPTINKAQNTLDVEKMEMTILKSEGRHDACIVPRVVPVIDSLAALVVADALCVHFGTDWLA